MLSSSLNVESPRNNGEIEAINNLSNKIEQFLKLSENRPNQEVKVDVNQQEVVSSVSSLGASILTGLAELKSVLMENQKPCEWEFKTVRHKYSNLIDTVIATKK
jgi:hypothetical protein